MKNEFTTSMKLQAKTESDKQQIKSILDTCTHVEVLDNGVHVSGHITFDQMKQIVKHLEIEIRQGMWYKCIRGVVDDASGVVLYQKGKYYLCPKDDILVTEDNRIRYWKKWHHPESCFIKEIPLDNN